MSEETNMRLIKRFAKNPHLLDLLCNIPKIDIQKKNEWATHKENIIREFPDTQYSNFTLKWMEIVQRVDNINDLIHNLFQDFIILNVEVDPDPIVDSAKKTSIFYKQKFLTEQIFYWIRKTVDEIISLIYVLKYLQENNDEYPNKIRIDCIGAFINSTAFVDDIKTTHLDILTIINDISNTYKHSFLNSEIHAYFGEKDPLVFAYGVKSNKLDNDVIFTQYRIEDIINSLNKLLFDLINYIKEI